MFVTESKLDASWRSGLFLTDPSNLELGVEFLVRFRGRTVWQDAAESLALIEGRQSRREDQVHERATLQQKRVERGFNFELRMFILGSDLVRTSSNWTQDCVAVGIKLARLMWLLISETM